VSISQACLSLHLCIVDSNKKSTPKKMETLNVKNEIKNVVLVHGAFADGSGFKALYNELTKNGYNVSVVQNP